MKNLSLGCVKLENIFRPEGKRGKAGRRGV